MPRRQSRNAGDKYLNWRNVTISISAAFAEDTSMPTDIIVASAMGKTRAWEIYMWAINVDQPQDVPAAGQVGEWHQTQLSHLGGLAAFLEIGDSGFIDHFQHRAWGDATSTTVVHTQYTMDGRWRQLRSIKDIYGETEIYVDDVMHIYSQNTAAGAANFVVSVAYKWVTLASQRLLELLQKWQ